MQNATDFLPILLQGAWVAIRSPCCRFLLSSAIDLVLALLKLSPIRALSWASEHRHRADQGLLVVLPTVLHIRFVLRTWAYT